MFNLGADRVFPFCGGTWAFLSLLRIDRVSFRAYSIVSWTMKVLPLNLHGGGHFPVSGTEIVDVRYLAR